MLPSTWLSEPPLGSLGRDIACSHCGNQQWRRSTVSYLLLPMALYGKLFNPGLPGYILTELSSNLTIPFALDVSLVEGWGKEGSQSSVGWENSFGGRRPRSDPQNPSDFQAIS